MGITVHIDSREGIDQEFPKADRVYETPDGRLQIIAGSAVLAVLRRWDGYSPSSSDNPEVFWYGEIDKDGRSFITCR